MAAFRRWVVLLLLPVGLASLLLGLLVPLPADWWDRQGFVVNLASGFTAACFGVPIAYYVIQYLLRKEDGDRRRRHLESLAYKVVTELATEARSFLRRPTNQSVAELVDTFSDLSARVRHVASAYERSSEVRPAFLDRMHATKLAKDLGAAQSALRATGILEQERFTVKWASLTLTWAIMYNEIIPQLRMQVAGNDEKHVIELFKRTVPEGRPPRDIALVNARAHQIDLHLSVATPLKRASFLAGYVDLEEYFRKIFRLVARRESRSARWTLARGDEYGINSTSLAELSKCLESATADLNSHLDFIQQIDRFQLLLRPSTQKLGTPLKSVGS